MAPSLLAIKLKTMLEEMNSGERIELSIMTTNGQTFGCYVDRTANNRWETHDDQGELDLETFVHTFLEFVHTFLEPKDIVDINIYEDENYNENDNYDEDDWRYFDYRNHWNY